MKDFSSTVNRIETKHLVVNQDYQKLLQDIKFDSFESIWQHRNGETIKNIKKRSVTRIEINQHNQNKIIYLKRHHIEFVGLSRLLSRFFSKYGLSQGRLEFENICDFRNNNLPTVIPVAAGEKFFRFFWAESFLITEDFSPYIALEELLEYRPHFFTGPAGETKKKILINEMAVLARRMHQNGFNHRDFNATHIILNYDNETDVPKIALFDLQRIDRNKFFKFRWKIKSLARLNYTLPDDIFSAEDKLNIFLSYKGKKRLNPKDSLEWLWIKRKTAKIKRHHEKTLAKREEKERKVSCKDSF
jgi:heptose I phosphotransferase